MSVCNCDTLWAHFPSPASRVNEYRAAEEWRRGKQRDGRKSCPLITMSAQSPTRISLWLDSDLGPDILLPYVGKCSWNYFHKHSQMRLRPERRFFIWFKATYLYSITRFINPIHRLLFKNEHNLGTICSGREKGPTDLGQTKRSVLSQTPSADKVPWI